MNDLQVFKNEEFGEIRTVTINDEVWFVAKDVANTLRYQNGSRDINRHVEEDDKMDGVTIRDSIGRIQTQSYFRTPFEK